MTENFSDFMKQLISHFYCNVCIMSTAAVYGNLLKHYNIIVAVCNLHFTRLCDLRRLRFLHKISVCQNVALKECTDVDYLCYEYNVNFSLSLSVIYHSVYCRKFGDICGM